MERSLVHGPVHSDFLLYTAFVFARVIPQYFSGQLEKAA